MSVFKVSDCAIPTIWCLQKQPPERKPADETYYTHKGNRYECMKKGFGAGMYTEGKKNLPVNSLQQIKYVGDVYQENFKENGIKNLSSLKKTMSKKTPKQIQKILITVFTKNGGSIDKRAYNSTILYLYRNGIKNVPKCSKIS